MNRKYRFKSKEDRDLFHHEALKVLGSMPSTVGDLEDHVEIIEQNYKQLDNVAKSFRGELIN